MFLYDLGAGLGTDTFGTGGTTAVLLLLFDLWADELVLVALLLLGVKPILEGSVGVCGKHRCLGVAITAPLSISPLLLLLVVCEWLFITATGSLMMSAVASADLNTGEGVPLLSFWGVSVVFLDSCWWKGVTTCTGLPGDWALPGINCLELLLLLTELELTLKLFERYRLLPVL